MATPIETSSRIQASRSTVAKTAGRAIADNARIIIAAWCPVCFALKRCTPCFVPPATADSPRIRSVFPMIEPVIEAFTRSTSPRRSAKIVMMSSAAFPNVALRRPPSELPRRVAACSVPRPIQPASGRSDRAEATKIVQAGASSSRHTIAIGSPRISGANQRIRALLRKGASAGRHAAGPDAVQDVLLEGVALGLQAEVERRFVDAVGALHGRLDEPELAERLGLGAPAGLDERVVFEEQVHVPLRRRVGPPEVEMDVGRLGAVGVRARPDRQELEAALLIRAHPGMQSRVLAALARVQTGRVGLVGVEDDAGGGSDAVGPVDHAADAQRVAGLALLDEDRLRGRARAGILGTRAPRRREKRRQGDARRAAHGA